MTLSPSTITTGDDVRWLLSPPDGATSVELLARANVAGAALAINASEDPTDGWVATLDAQATAALAPGTWAYQLRASVDGLTTTFERGTFVVAPSLEFLGEGDAPAVDPRSQAAIDLEQVNAAIRAITSGAQSYTIGSGAGSRSVTRANLTELMAWRDRLLAQVAAEQRTAVRTDRRILTRFVS